jgi:hypothetical protein
MRMKEYAEYDALGWQSCCAMVRSQRERYMRQLLRQSLW